MQVLEPMILHGAPFARLVGNLSWAAVADLVAQQALQVCSIAACCLHMPASATVAACSIWTTSGHH